MNPRTSTLPFSSSIRSIYSRHPRSSIIHRHNSRFLSIRSCLPFPAEKARYHRELRIAVDVVHRACRLCVNVQSSSFADDGGILEKSDLTPVTVADFGVQALISLGLSKWFPSIPLVAEEDSEFLVANNLVDAVVNAVNDNTGLETDLFTDTEVLQAIDRGRQGSLDFGAKPTTYWVLDPIDGTRGFLRGGNALYVVGLALIIEGQVVLGVMGCPNWQGHFDSSSTPTADASECVKGASELGILMVAYTGCGTWRMGLSSLLDGGTTMDSSWTRCFVDQCSFIHEAVFCLPDSQTRDSFPLSLSFDGATDNNREKEALLLPTCCGSLCKYLMVASGRASVFILRTRDKTSVKAWDHAAGVICVHEAGGQVTDWRGTSLDFAADESDGRVIFPLDGVLVTNGNLQYQILQLLSSKSDAA